MNSSFPNRWSFSYLNFTKYVTNIIDEPKYKYGQPWNGHYKNTGGLKPVLRDPNLALSFCYMTRIINNGSGNVKHIKQTFSLTVSRMSSYWSELVKIKYNAEGNADSLRVATKSCKSKHYKYEPQQKHRLGTVSKNYWGLKPVLREPNLTQLLSWLKTYSCSVRMKVF